MGKFVCGWYDVYVRVCSGEGGVSVCVCSPIRHIHMMLFQVY